VADSMMKCRIHDTACINADYCTKADACCAGDPACKVTCVLVKVHDDHDFKIELVEDSVIINRPVMHSSGAYRLNTIDVADLTRDEARKLGEALLEIAGSRSDDNLDADVADAGPT
jgi:hypothetical protein